MDQKPNDNFNFSELFDTPIEPLPESSNPVQDIPNITPSPPLDTLEPHRSGRIARASDKFMFLREPVSDKHDLNPSNHNEAISDKDSKN